MDDNLSPLPKTASKGLVKLKARKGRNNRVEGDAVVVLGDDNGNRRCVTLLPWWVLEKARAVGTTAATHQATTRRRNMEDVSASLPIE